MNSMSTTRCNNDRDDTHRNSRKNEVLLKCKTSNSATVTANTDDEVTRRIATLTLNTDKFCIPCIKFEFSTNVIITGDTANTRGATINFQLFRLCRRETVATPIGNEWTFSGGFFPPARTTADVVTFIVCDCDCDCDCIKDDCCTYFIEATIIADAAGASPGSATVTFNNSTLSALVVEKIIHCC